MSEKKLFGVLTESCCKLVMWESRREGKLGTVNFIQEYEWSFFNEAYFS